MVAILWAVYIQCPSSWTPFCLFVRACEIVCHLTSTVLKPSKNISAAKEVAVGFVSRKGCIARATRLCYIHMHFLISMYVRNVNG